ncbi:MAG TPA: MarR family transcriptional regulator [Longimicrobium sp.]|nr:MarR family transcriptional regulator [Longimicrobium sp.]
MIDDAHAPADVISPEMQTPLKLWVVLARACSAVSRHVEAHVASRGLASATEFGVLEALYHKGTLRHGDLQEKVLVTSGAITYVVDRLAAKGLVERRECDSDRRVRYVALTPAGDEFIRDVFNEHARAIARALGGLAPEEQAAATCLLRVLGRAAAELPVQREG